LSVNFLAKYLLMNKLLVLFVFSALLLQGCKTSFRISVKEPAIVKINESITTYGIINNVDQENSPEKKIAGIILGTESINGNVEAAERAVDGALRALEKSGYLKGQTLSNDVVLHKENGDVDWEELKQIAQEKNVEGFIELTQMETLSPVGGNVLANASGQRSTRLEGTMYVNYYVPSTKQKYERYKVFYVYNISLSGSTNVIDLFNDVQRKKEHYKALGFQLGYKAGRLISPNWVWVGRDYYTRGSKVLKRARPMIKEGNWDIAEEQLLMGLGSGSDKVLGRTTFNLALVKEGQGEIDEAIKYAKESALNYGNKLANEYLDDLKKRKRKLEEMGY
jgi:hypothetical protein